MISLHYSGEPGLSGAEPAALAPYAAYDPIRQIERASIREFMERHREYLRGRVLDFGAGKSGTCAQPQPYRGLVEGEYVPFDIGDLLPLELFDVVMSTQVLQFMTDPQDWLRWAWKYLNPGGHLVMTYPTAWPEIDTEPELWRFTKCGIEQLLATAGFTVVHHELRAEVLIDQFAFQLGYGLIARK